MGIVHTLWSWKLRFSTLMNWQSPVGQPEPGTYGVLTTYCVPHRALGPGLECVWWTPMKESCPQDSLCLAFLPL